MNETRFLPADEGSAGGRSVNDWELQTMRCLLSVLIAAYAHCVFMPCLQAQAADPPEWAVMECRGLKAWTEVVYYWIDRQRPDGSFGFGLNDDCEFYEMWPVLVFAADDQRVVDSLNRAVDWVWYDDGVQEGYHSGARDAGHAGEVTTCTTPLLTIADYGNPVLVERLMMTAKNMEKWTAVNDRGHRHFRSNFFGSIEMWEHAYFGSDATVNGRATIPMVHLLWYNRDPDLARYCIEWGRAWIDHAKETTLGKPYGLLPVEVVFKTDEPGGFTRCWAAGAVTTYAQRFQFHEMLIMDYLLTGDPDFLLPARTEMELFGRIKDGILPEGSGMRIQDGTRSNVQVQTPEGQWEPVRYDRVGAELIQFYRVATGDHRYDRWWGAPPRVTRKTALETGRQAVRQAGEQAAKAKAINILNGTDNYEASIDELGSGFPMLYYGMDHSTLDISSFPLAPVRWLKGDYELAVVMVDHDRASFKAVCCNVGDKTRSFGAQFFELDPGTYRLTLGIDTDADDRPERIVLEENVAIERGSKVFFDLERGHEYVLELRQLAAGPQWTPRADVAVCRRDIFARPAAPEPGAQAELEVRVHNIGTRDALAVDVWAEESGTGTFIGCKSIQIVPCPKQMVPSHVSVTFPWKVSAAAKGVKVRVDGGNVIEEIYEGNNEAELALADIPDGPRPKRFIYLPGSWRDEQKGPVPTYSAPCVENIVIDGRLDEPAWAQAERRGPLSQNDGAPAVKPTFVRLAYGPDALYVAVEAFEPRMDLLVAKARKHDDGGIFGDDSVELFIDANFDKLTYHQFAVSAAGAMIEGRHYNFTLYNEPWESKVQKGKDVWTVEAKIPFTSLGTKPRPGDTWGVNVYRTAMSFTVPEDVKEREKGWKHMEQIALSPVYSGYHQPGRFAAVTFGPKP